MQPVQTAENIHTVPNQGGKHASSAKRWKTSKNHAKRGEKKTPLVLNAENHVTDERGTKRGKHVKRWREGETSVGEVTVSFVSHCHKSSTAYNAPLADQ